jgi:hypothetical protein
MKTRNGSSTGSIDFSKGVRGKYARRMAGANVVVVEPELAGIFPDSRSVNRALREFRAQRVAALIADLKRNPPRPKQKSIRAQLRRLGHRGGLRGSADSSRQS